MARAQGDPLGWGPFSTSPLWPIDPKPITPATVATEFLAEWAPGSDFWRSLIFGAGQMVFGQAGLLYLGFGLWALGLAGLGTMALMNRRGWQSWLPRALLATAAVGLNNRLSTAEAGALAPNVGVTFGQQIELMRADLEQQRTEPGGSVQARLVWRSLDDVPRSYRAFVHLIGMNGKAAGHVDRVPAEGAASTALWRRGDFIYDVFDVSVRPDAEPGLYDVVSGFYRFPDLARLPAEGAAARPGSTALLGKVKILRPIAPPPGPPYAVFGDELALADWAVTAPLGPQATVRLSWLAQARPSADYVVSVQLLSPAGMLVSQHDSPPLSGALPTSSWDPGDVIEDVTLPNDGAADLTAHVIVYRSTMGQRLPVAGGGDSYALRRRP